jgi:hypothetical protein
MGCSSRRGAWSCGGYQPVEKRAEAAQGCGRLIFVEIAKSRVSVVGSGVGTSADDCQPTLQRLLLRNLLILSALPPTIIGTAADD